MTLVAMATKFGTKGFNSACIRDIREIFVYNRGFSVVAWLSGLVVARWSRSTKLPYAGPG